MTKAGRRIREQYADAGGFTGHVFVFISLPGHPFIPRIRDLPSKRLHVLEPGRVPQPLIELAGGRIREDVMVGNRPDVLRVAAALASRILPPSQLLRRFAAHPPSTNWAVALPEIGGLDARSSWSTGCQTPTRLCTGGPWVVRRCGPSSGRGR